MSSPDLKVVSGSKVKTSSLKHACKKRSLDLPVLMTVTDASLSQFTMILFPFQGHPQTFVATIIVSISKAFM